MLGARKIVSSYGTFVAAVMKISPTVEAVYAFDNVWVRNDRLRFRQDVVIGEFRDARGAYTKHGEWLATDEQLEQMLNYPMEDIVEIA